MRKLVATAALTALLAFGATAPASAQGIDFGSGLLNGLFGLSLIQGLNGGNRNGGSNQPTIIMVPNGNQPAAAPAAAPPQVIVVPQSQAPAAVEKSGANVIVVTPEGQKVTPVQ